MNVWMTDSEPKKISEKTDGGEEVICSKSYIKRGRARMTTHFLSVPYNTFHVFTKQSMVKWKSQDMK